MNNDKPRLLIFHPALAPYRLDFFNALADRFTCHVVLLQRENPALFIKQDQLLAEARFTYAYLDRHFTLAGRDINLGYASAIRHFRPDIVLCSEFNLSVLSAALYRWRHPRRFRLFTMCDDSIAMAERCQGGRRRRRAALIRCLDGIVNISEETAAWFLRHTPARRTFSFPIIRAEQTFVCHRPTAARYVSTHQLAGMKVGLFVGRFVDVKNLPALIEAFRRVCERNAAAANYRLVLVGSGEQAKPCSAAAVRWLVPMPVRANSSGVIMEKSSTHSTPKTSIQPYNKLMLQPPPRRPKPLSGLPACPSLSRSASKPSAVFFCPIKAFPDKRQRAHGVDPRAVVGANRQISPAGTYPHRAAR